MKTSTPGRPRMTSSEANIRRVKDILEVNPRMSVREIVENLSLSRSTVHRILKAHLKFRNVYCVKRLLRETTAHLAKLKLQLVKQSPYSPDLNMCYRFLFRKIKSGIKHSSFNGPEDVETAVRRAFDRIPELELMRELEKLKTHCDGIIEQSGVYL